MKYVICSLLGFCTGICVYFLSVFLIKAETGNFPVTGGKKFVCMLVSAFVCGALCLLLAIYYKGAAMSLIIAMLICQVLVLVSLCDLVSMIVPSVALFLLFILSTAYSAFDVLTGENMLVCCIDHLCGCAFSFIILYLPYKLSVAAKGREGIGVGDIKLMTLLGLTLGLPGSFITVFIASISASLILLILRCVQHIKYGKASKSKEYPFAPFICISALSALLFEDEIISLYLLTFDTITKLK